jgi:hypothetical protein
MQTCRTIRPKKFRKSAKEVPNASSTSRTGAAPETRPQAARMKKKKEVREQPPINLTRSCPEAVRPGPTPAPENAEHDHGYDSKYCDSAERHAVLPRR